MVCAHTTPGCLATFWFIPPQDPDVLRCAACGLTVSVPGIRDHLFANAIDLDAPRYGRLADERTEELDGLKEK